MYWTGLWIEAPAVCSSVLRVCLSVHPELPRSHCLLVGATVLLRTILFLVWQKFKEGVMASATCICYTLELKVQQAAANQI